ncbi:MAG TPA: DNA repair protein RecO C-terminal domain-containing protein, partial [Cellvibrionaceae bacterium]|nr:DNA repair protein RecO C-terminal domain-containing protein [Cellvibrionaceae bacterium]
RYWVDLIAQNHGRVSTLWRKSKKTPSLVPFTPYHAIWEMRGQQRLLTCCEPLGAPLALTGSALFCGFYLNELCERLLLLDEPSPIPFGIYEQALHGLLVEEQLERPLRYFEWQLICYLGFEFSFTQEGFSGAPIQANLIYQFNPRVGFERVGFSGSSVTFSGESLLAIGAGDTEGDSAKILKRVFRQALQHKLGPKPLKSRDYFR